MTSGFRSEAVSQDRTFPSLAPRAVYPCVAHSSRELEPADDVLGGHLFERLSQGLVDGILVPRRDPAEVRLDLRPESLDRRVVRAVGRQGQEPGTRPPDGRRRGRGLMGGQVVPYDHVAGVQLRHQHLLDIRLERRGVGRPREHQGGTYPVQTQRGDHGQRFPRAGGRADGPLAARGPAVGLGHRRGHPRLVHENQPFRLDPLHLPPERPPLLLDVGPVALVGVLGLLLAGQSLSPQGAPDRRQAAVEATPLLQLVQGVVVVLPDQIFQAPQVVRAQHGGRAAPVRLRGQRILLTPPLQQPGDERDADSEEAGDLALRALVLIHGRRDPLPQVYRRGTHGRYLLIRCRLLPRSCPSM